MLQKELADRICASPKSTDYGSLSVYVQLKAEAEKVLFVSRKVFLPPPKIDSEVIILTRKNIDSNDEEFDTFVKRCFQHKRKTLLNNLKHYFSADFLNKLFVDNDISSTARAEELRPETFSAMYAFVEAHNKSSKG